MSQEYEIKIHDCGQKYASWATEKYQAEVRILKTDTENDIQQSIVKATLMIEKDIERQG